MKVQIYSDLHIERKKKYLKIKKLADILILAGDINNIESKRFDNFFKYLIECEYKYIIYVLGNHEFYCKSTYDKTLEKYREYFDQYDNIFLLENNKITIDGYTFLGSTFWSKCEKDIIKELNDFYFMSYEKYLELNKTAEEYIFSNIDNDTINVLITHFPLINKNIAHPKYSESILNNYFSNNMLHKMNDKIKICIHGHTHFSCDFIYNNIRFISNQCGYSLQESIESNFNIDGVYEI